MEAPEDAHWLLNYHTLRLVNQCRSLIRAEFGIRLSLSDPGLREKVALFTAKSRSNRLQAVYQQLQDLLGEAVEQFPPQQMYRGQPVLKETQPAAETSGRTQRVYRGRVVQNH